MATKISRTNQHARARRSHPEGLQTRIRFRSKEHPSDLRGNVMLKQFDQQLQEQRVAVNQADDVSDRLKVLARAMRQLLMDKHFVNLLRKQKLDGIPEQLSFLIEILP